MGNFKGMDDGHFARKNKNCSKNKKLQTNQCTWKKYKIVKEFIQKFILRPDKFLLLFKL